MKKLFNVILISSLLSISGCALFRNPLRSWDKAQEKVEKTAKKLEKNDSATLEKGINYVYATKLVLEADPSTNHFHNIETKFNDKALLALGQPSMENANTIRNMVIELTSTNPTIVAKGEKKLSYLDAQLITLQKGKTILNTDLEKATQKVLDVADINASLASKWVNLIKIFWYLVYFMVAVFIFKILAVVVPPPYNSVFGIVDFVLGGIIRFVFKLAPKAMDTAKVVGSEYEVAIKHIVSSIEQAKTKVKAQNTVQIPGSDLADLKAGQFGNTSSPVTVTVPSVGLTQLKEELKTETDETSKALINKTKESLGLL